MSHQPFEFFEQINNHVNKSYLVDIKYLDFQKVFDQIPVQSLLSNLSNYGLKGWVTI